MKINWKKEEMKKYLEALNNKDRLDEYEQSISDFYLNYLLDFPLEEILKDEETKINPLTEEEIAKQLENKCAQFENFLNSFPKRVYENIFNLVDSLKNIYIDTNEVKRKNIKVTKQELFDTSYEVFGTISPYFSRTIDYIYDKGLIKINKFNKKIINDSVTIFDDFNKVGYIYIENDKNYSLESIFNHELAHLINFLSISNYNDTLFAEFNSIYANLYTDKYLYEKTKDGNYYKSYYNYLVYLQKIIRNFGYMEALFHCKKFTKKEITDNFYRVLSYDLEDSFNDFFTGYLANFDLNKFTYLLSGISAINLLEQDPEYARRKYIDLMFYEFKNMNEALKMLDLNLKDEYYMCDLFNKVNSEAKIRVKKL